MSDFNKVNTINDDNEEVLVITRTGKKEPLDMNQITNRLQHLCNRSPKIHHINPYNLMSEICKGLKSNITTWEIDEYAANASASLSVGNPYYLKIAARIAIDNHQKNTQRSFVDKMRNAYLNKDYNNNVNSLISSEFFKYVEAHQDFIENTIDYNKDFLLDFFGFRTFQKSFSLRINGNPIERPQDMFMRTAIALHMNTNGENIQRELELIAETYTLLSEKYYTHASPTYYNAGGNRPQYASCFLLGTADSREGIMKTADDISQISKWAGGIGVHVNCWRGTGSKIRGTNGISSGIIPWLKIYQETLRGFNQGGRRPGKAAIYLMPHHPDIIKFLALGRNNGADEVRARDLFYAMWIPDIFMERVKSGATWSLFDPDVCQVDLSNLTGSSYREKYLELEAAGKFSSQLPARTIWEAIYETNKDIGHPYICFSDNVNKQSMQKNLGVIKSSNLCAEIVLYSNDEEYAVCILSSISLPSFVFDGYSAEEIEANTKSPESARILNHEFPVNPYFDYKKLISVVKTVTRNLNLIIDKTYHPVKETARSNERHRPIGVGVQGLDDTYAKMRMPFASQAAAKLNKNIFETIYYATTTASTLLAKELYQSYKATCTETGSVSINVFDVNHYNNNYITYTNSKDIPTRIGSYPSFEWNGGSPLANGKFHWELNDKVSEDSLMGIYDWETLRSHVNKFGVRNSLTVAVMPTASTSQLLGNNECVEPYTSNIYKRATQAGEYIVVKKYLINDLYSLNLWDNNMKDNILASSGSIQYIDEIPAELKKLYPTVWEIDQAVLIQQAIDRQPFVDQAQSLNLYIQDLSITKWNKLMFTAWENGLKTGKYYLHSRAAVQALKFTIDPSKQEEIANKIASKKITHGTAFLEPLREVCDVCSG